MTILEKIREARGGHYCHCVEVENAYDLENISEQIILEFQDDHTEDEIIDFLGSLEVYALNDSNEDEIWEFSFHDYIKGTLV